MIMNVNQPLIIYFQGVSLQLGSLPAGCKPCNQLDYFRQIIRAYQGRDEDAVKYVKKVKALIDKPLDGPCGP